MLFKKILKESDRRPNKIWVDEGNEFYNNSFRKWLRDNDMEIIQQIMKKNLLLLKDLLEY